MNGTTRQENIFIKNLHELKHRSINGKVTEDGEKERHLQKWLFICYLSVHKDIDNGVIDSGALSKVGRHGCCKWVKSITRVCSSKADKESVRSPAENISSNHDTNHSRDFLFSLLCWFRFLLLCCNLLEIDRPRMTEPLWEKQKFTLYFKNGISYSTDGQQHRNVAENDQSQGDNAAADHQCNHVRPDSRVFISTEYIWSTRGLEAMRPIPVGHENCRDHAFYFTLVYIILWLVKISN